MATGTPSTRRCNLTKKDFLGETPLTSTRYTPYTRSAKRPRTVSATPLPQKQGTIKSAQRSQSRRRVASKEPNVDISSIVAGRTWRLYRASPFYGLKLDRKSLKVYEKTLNAWFLKESKPTVQQQNINQARRKTVFNFIEDGQSFLIEIKVLSNDESKKDSPDLLAVLYSGMNNENSFSKNHNFVSLPICLVRSGVLLKESFFQWLEGQFGCKLTQLLFSPVDLAWLVSLCSGIGEPSHVTELTYHGSAMVPELDTICLTILAKDAKKIWDTIHRTHDSGEFFTSKEASKFLKSLESHFYHHFKINLDQMQLYLVCTSVAYFGKEGQLKILQGNFVSYILQQIASTQTW